MVILDSGCNIRILASCSDSWNCSVNHCRHSYCDCCSRFIADSNCNCASTIKDNLNMINAYTALMYGILIGYGICAILHHKKKFKADWLALVILYTVLLLLSLKIEL